MGMAEGGCDMVRGGGLTLDGGIHFSREREQTHFAPSLTSTLPYRGPICSRCVKGVAGSKQREVTAFDIVTNQPFLSGLPLLAVGNDRRDIPRSLGQDYPAYRNVSH